MFPLLLKDSTFSVAQRQFLTDARFLNCLRMFCSKKKDEQTSLSSSGDIASDASYVPRRYRKRQADSLLSSQSRSVNVTRTSESENHDKLQVKGMLDDMITNSDKDRGFVETFSSDVHENRKSKEQEKHSQIMRPEIDPETKSFTFFPGQGSQFVGMGKQLLPFPGVKGLYDHASEILKYDLLKLCLYGPKSELDKTIHCQPAVFVTSVAAIERLKEENFQGIENTIATAGYSVGEFAAMVFAGMMSFEDALSVVKVRAQAMQRASEETPSGMMTVFCFWGTKLNLATEAAKQYCKEHHHIEDPVCKIASYLFPEVKVIAGHDEALDFIEKNKKDFGIRSCKRIAVSGAFHTPLMDSARKPVSNALRRIEIHRPKFPILSNVTSNRLQNNANFHKTIVNQLVKPVKWEQIMSTLFTRDKTKSAFPYTYECGPGNQLGIFLDKMNSKAFKNYRNIQV
ncbi:fabD [Mytilus coruscus]|uniref:[acyl-carrier-protein] S-malonyltransferase n=1 Tax=Mytilus coruscus TaxID=42192 RepID=A0A6J8F0Z8_MYTCO|nr:fabD [Mytilus coruscus]